jgi:hypothetical protein
VGRKWPLVSPVPGRFQAAGITDSSSLARFVLEFQGRSLSHHFHGPLCCREPLLLFSSSRQVQQPLGLFLQISPAMDLCSTGLPDRGGHMPRCSLWAPVGLAQAWKRLVQAASLTRVRKLAADLAAVEDARWCRRSSPETAEQKQPTPKRRAPLLELLSARKPPFGSTFSEPADWLASERWF